VSRYRFSNFFACLRKTWSF